MMSPLGTGSRGTSFAIDPIVAVDLFTDAQLGRSILPAPSGGTTRVATGIAAKLAAVTISAGMLGSHAEMCPGWFKHALQTCHDNKLRLFDPHLIFHSAPIKTNLSIGVKAKSTENGQKKWQW